jgi:hypothetical protein
MNERRADQKRKIGKRFNYVFIVAFSLQLGFVMHSDMTIRVSMFTVRATFREHGLWFQPLCIWAKGKGKVDRILKDATRHVNCATNRNVAGSIPNGVTGIFH